MEPANILKEVRQELEQLSGDPENIRDYSRFHKDNKKHIGLATPFVKKLSAGKFKKVKHLDKKQIFEFCEKLLECDGSCQTIAFDWAFRIRERYTKEDFAIFEKWLDRYVDTWGNCDDLCTHAFGYFLSVFRNLFPKFTNGRDLKTDGNEELLQ